MCAPRDIAKGIRRKNAEDISWRQVKEDLEKPKASSSLLSVRR